MHTEEELFGTVCEVVQSPAWTHFRCVHFYTFLFWENLRFTSFKSASRLHTFDAVALSNDMWCGCDRWINFMWRALIQTSRQAPTRSEPFSSIFTLPTTSNSLTPLSFQCCICKINFCSLHVLNIIRRCSIYDREREREWEQDMTHAENISTRNLTKGEMKSEGKKKLFRFNSPVTSQFISVQWGRKRTNKFRIVWVCGGGVVDVLAREYRVSHIVNIILNLPYISKTSLFIVCIVFCVVLNVEEVLRFIDDET